MEEQGILKDLYLFFMISHSYINDLAVKLVSPAGEGTVLHQRSEGAEDDIIAEYTPNDTILHLDVTMDISHSWIGDLQMVLLSPSG